MVRVPSLRVCGADEMPIAPEAERRDGPAAELPLKPLKQHLGERNGMREAEGGRYPPGDLENYLSLEGRMRLQGTLR